MFELETQSIEAKGEELWYFLNTDHGFNNHAKDCLRQELNRINGLINIAVKLECSYLGVSL